MKPDFSDDILTLLRHVHINMPYKVLPQYREMTRRYRFNLEMGFDAADLDRVPRGEFRAVAARLEKNHCRISLHGPFWDLCSGSVDPLIRQVTNIRFRQLFDIMDIFRPLQVVCHTGWDPSHHRGHRDEWLEHGLKFWEPMVERASKMKIPLLLENVWDYGPEVLAELFRRIDSPFLGFCLDVGHQHSFSKTPLHEWLEALCGRLMEIHLHDNDGSGDAHLPVGHGTFDFRLLFDFLRERQRTPLLTLEPHLEEHLFQSLSGLQEVLTACGSFQPGQSFAWEPPVPSSEGGNAG